MRGYAFSAPPTAASVEASPCLLHLSSQPCPFNLIPPFDILSQTSHASTLPTVQHSHLLHLLSIEYFHTFRSTGSVSSSTGPQEYFGRAVFATMRANELIAALGLTLPVLVSALPSPGFAAANDISDTHHHQLASHTHHDKVDQASNEVRGEFSTPFVASAARPPLSSGVKKMSDSITDEEDYLHRLQGREEDGVHEKRNSGP